jgi:hypothetical protein
MNIFYTEVDKNLQTELNARGRSGFQDRTNEALDFMLSKIANVRIIAYQGNDSKSGIVTNPQAILGGAQVRGGRYLPTAEDGFLTDRWVDKSQIAFYDQFDVAFNNINSALGGKNDKNVVLGNAYLKETPMYDQSRRIGPYITSIEVAIGDHSMGLLNKATVNISIPNVTRDLDDIEEVYFRPGRYLSIEIMHPESALVSRTDTGGMLTARSLPNKERIKELYPKWDVDDFLKQISKMNTFTFEGLITSFDFSYTTDGTVEATLSLTGTSNVYTDVSMYLSGKQKNQKTSTPGSTTENFSIQPIIKTTPAVIGEEETQKEIQLWEVIQNRVDFLVNNFKTKSDATRKFNQFLLPFSTTEVLMPATDHFLLVGEQYVPKIQSQQIPEAKNEYKIAGKIKKKLLDISNFDALENSTFAREQRATQLGITPADLLTKVQARTGAETQATLEVNDPRIWRQILFELNTLGLTTANEYTIISKDLDNAQKEYDKQQQQTDKRNVARSEFIENFNTGDAQSNYNRYITLGALIQVINEYVISNITGSAKAAEIIHTDAMNFSNYYPLLVSTSPEEILFLPKDPSQVYDMNSYASLESILAGTELIYYKDVVKQIDTYGLTPEALKSYGWKEWPGVYEKQGAAAKMYPSRIFINLEKIQSIITSITQQKKTFTVKQFIQQISATVARCSGNAIDLKLVSYPDDPSKLMLTDTKYLKSVSETVIPYSVPMFANHPNGSIVREFSFSAKLPESVKNLSYVLNQGDNVTEDQIAPYMNFMYNSKNPEQINEVLKTYKNKFTKNIQQLTDAKRNYGLSPGVIERKQALYKAVTDYIKFPTDDIRTSQQITAPIFPFDVSFTIDGINGLRYGDVLVFKALPLKYQINTVFSIIGITHNVDTDGQWTTQVKCIMRPSIE